MSDLVTWLRAQLDEDELDARRGDFHTGICSRFLDPGGDCSCDYSDRVLLDVQAKRRILELHGAVLDGKDRAVCEYCDSLCHSRSGLRCDDPDAPFPCPTMRLLALPYADRDGYREEWRP